MMEDRQRSAWTPCLLGLGSFRKWSPTAIARYGDQLTNPADGTFRHRKALAPDAHGTFISARVPSLNSMVPSPHMLTVPLASEANTSAMKAAQKTAIVLTTTSADCVDFLLDRLRGRGYAVPILVTAPGPNAFLTDSHVENMRSRISSYALEIGVDGIGESASQGRPAILLVHRSGQIEPLTTAYDPDLVLSLGFPYPLGPRLLSHRAKFVNLHAAPLPELPGPTPQIWPILRPDIFPPENFLVTWHYMTPGVDEGKIITQTAVELEQNDQRTASELHKLAVMQGLSGMDEALELVESGYEGHTQRKKDPLSEGSSPEFSGLLSDSARMITPDMSAGEIQTLFRAIGDSEWPPLINVHGGLYAVKKMVKPHRKDDIILHGEPGLAVRTGFTTTYHCMGGPLLFTLRKL